MSGTEGRVEVDIGGTFTAVDLTAVVTGTRAQTGGRVHAIETRGARNRSAVVGRRRRRRNAVYGMPAVLGE